MSPKHARPQDKMLQDTPFPDPQPEADGLILAAETMAGLLHKARTEIGRVIFGQQDVIDLALITLLSGGHALLVGVPGLAKTRLVETLGRVLGLDSRRIQFTPDLMPADILGSEILEEGPQGRAFRFIRGPVFAELVMADEINRASPRTQSALLQAMQEGAVSIAGERHALPKPFHVLATQNPIEQEGTYPLPEAQLDRFLLEIRVDYPDRAAEKRMMIETTRLGDSGPEPVFAAQTLLEAQRLVRALPVGERVVEAMLDLVRAARPGSGASEAAALEWGPGPRAGQALMLAARARALLEGRLSPSTEDVYALAVPVLRHRMALTFAARAQGVQLEALIATLAARTLRHG